jgi:quinol monooxygenase YgiN
MDIKRRIVIAGAASAAFAPRRSTAQEKPAMYGMIGKMTAKAGQGAALLEALMGGIEGMPGCLSYIVARDPKDADVLWVTEAWDSAESHAASLKLPAVQASIARARPLIAGMDVIAETQPVGGVGLKG